MLLQKSLFLMLVKVRLTFARGAIASFSKKVSEIWPSGKMEGDLFPVLSSKLLVRGEKSN